ncbi:MAG: FtsH protease activity modulator HflK [Methylobacter sp.]
MYGKRNKKNIYGSNNEKPSINVFIDDNLAKIALLYDQLKDRITNLNFARLLFLIIPVIWLASGIYIVDEGNRGIVTRFGAYHDTTLPGPHWHVPFPIETAEVVNIANQRFIEVGYRTSDRTTSGSVPAEALMLTEDENIIDVKLAVQYQIKNAKDYLFNVENQEASLKLATQSAERAIIGKNNMDFVLTEGRSTIVAQIQQVIQKIMDDYKSGISITSVNLQDAQPPEQVQASFEDAIKAREDKQRLVNEAEAYANEIIPKARGAAARKIQEAEAYKQQVIATATGDISRFSQLYTEYKKAPQVTRKRLLIEAMESVLSQSDIVMLDNPQSNNLLYLPLDKLGAHRQLTDSLSARKDEMLADQKEILSDKIKRSSRGRI